MPVNVTAVRVRVILLLSAVLLLSACALPVGPLRGSEALVTPPAERGLPRVSLFLSLRDERSPLVRMEIAELEVLSGTIWYPLTRGPITLDSSLIGGGQILFGGSPLPTGPLSQLRLTITDARSGATGAVRSPLISAPLVLELPLTGALELGSGDSRTLLLTWDVEASLSREGGFSPVISAMPAVKELPFDLLYVSCPDIDTIFVIRADTHRVVDSFGVGGGVTSAALDPVSAERLYLLAPVDRQIKVVDPDTYRVVDFFSTPLNDVPTFMTLDAEGRSAYLLDERSGYVSRMDLSSGRISARVAVGYRPAYALYLPQQNLLAVSLDLSQTVLLLDPATLQVRGSLSSGSGPQGLAVSDNQLYVAERGDNSVAVFDLSSRTRHERISVGYGPQRILATQSQVYVTHAADASIAVLAPGQLGIFREISGLGLPQDMVYRPLLRKLYVTDRSGGGIAVIDVNTNRQVGYIELGARPHGLVTGP